MAPIKTVPTSKAKTTPTILPVDMPLELASEAPAASALFSADAVTGAVDVEIELEGVDEVMVTTRADVRVVGTVDEEMD
jgi:hypothetical protein